MFRHVFKQDSEVAKEYGVYIQKVDTSGNILLGANAAQLVAISATYYNPIDFTITSNGVISIYTIGSNVLSQTLAAIKNEPLLVSIKLPNKICTEDVLESIFSRP